MGVFVIAEAGSSHDNDLAKAHRLIEAAKECGADACKFQFWSNSKALADRRKLGKDAEAVYAKYKLPQGWLPILAEKCEKVGLEFMCSHFLPQDADEIAKYCKTAKISAFECEDDELVSVTWARFNRVIMSVNPEKRIIRPHDNTIEHLHCISEYPTPIERLQLHLIRERGLKGFSDHSADVLAGAAAVAAGAKIIEAHIRLHDTEPSNPDYGHSFCAEDAATVSDVWEAGNKYQMISGTSNPFEEYVQNIRTVEKML